MVISKMSKAKVGDRRVVVDWADRTDSSEKDRSGREDFKRKKRRGISNGGGKGASEKTATKREKKKEEAHTKYHTKDDWKRFFE